MDIRKNSQWGAGGGVGRGFHQHCKKDERGYVHPAKTWEGLYLLATYTKQSRGIMSRRGRGYCLYTFTPCMLGNFS